MAKTPLDKCELMVARRARIARIHRLANGVGLSDPELRRLWGKDGEPAYGVPPPVSDAMAEHAYHTNASVRQAVEDWRREQRWASTLAEIRKAWGASGFVEETF